MHLRRFVPLLLTGKKNDFTEGERNDEDYRTTHDIDSTTDEDHRQNNKHWDKRLWKTIFLIVSPKWTVCDFSAHIRENVFQCCDFRSRASRIEHDLSLSAQIFAQRKITGLIRADFLCLTSNPSPVDHRWQKQPRQMSPRCRCSR